MVMFFYLRYYASFMIYWCQKPISVEINNEIYVICRILVNHTKVGTMQKIKSNIAVSDSGFLLNPSTGESFSLNPMGVKMIKKMNEGKDFREIEVEIMKEYDVSSSMFDKDFQDFVGVLKQYNLLEPENDNE
jgi:hypothetical protein